MAVLCLRGVAGLEPWERGRENGSFPVVEESKPQGVEEEGRCLTDDGLESSHPDQSVFSSSHEGGDPEKNRNRSFLFVFMSGFPSARE